MEADALRRIVSDSLALKQRFFEEQAERLLDLGARLASRLTTGGRLLAFGNGGSAADAQHFVAELVVRLARPRRALPALALTTDPSVLTASANDFGYEAVFRRQVEAHGRPGDVALGISTSGRSPSVVEALRAARKLGLHTVGLTGEGGGALAGLVHDLVEVPHRDAQRVQEVHGMVLHLLAEIVDEAARG
jgi:D-sedoheptulose 7-phosphate isomerase